MKCQRQPRFLENKPVRISHVLEIRLAPDQWNRIKFQVWWRRRTYSTLTRYCVMRLARKCSLRWTPKLRVSAQKVRAGLHVAQELHRHVMCLYGEDEKLIRLAAMELGLTITAFVRLALECYLPLLAMENRNRRAVTDAHLTWEGIRFTETVQIFATNGGDRPFSRMLSYLGFAIEGYW